MSNSRALASNQRPNKTTPSRVGPVLLHPCLRCFTFLFLRRNSSSPPPAPLLFALSTLLLPTGLACVFHVGDHSPSTAKTSHFAETRATPDAGKRVLILFLLSFPLTPPRPLRSRLCNAPFPRLSRCQMEIARETCRHVDEIFAYSPDDSRIVCFDVHIYLTGISTGVVPPARVALGTVIHLSRGKLLEDNDLILRDRIFHFRC